MSSRVGENAVEVRLLGELEWRLGGRAQALPASKKTRALLAYLVATARPHLRESLCTLLWDGPDDPRAELRWSLTKIRPILHAGCGELVADRERVGFVAGAVSVDVAIVRKLLGDSVDAVPTASLRAAAGLYRGEFLEGLDLPGCFRYHEWCVAEREALRALRTAALAELVARLSRDGDGLQEALRWARERVAFDPLTEAAHVDVVRILGRLGHVREALAQYETCRRILETELGARASSALELVRHELTAPQATLPSTVPESLPSAEVAREDSVLRAAASRPPLVGREACRAAIAAAVAAARSAGLTPGLLFVGDPGIGKTRLLDLVADEALAARGTVLRGRAFEAEMGRPYGPWLDALSSAPLPPGAPLGLDLAPLLSPTAEVDAGAAVAPNDRGRLFDAVAALLTYWAGRTSPLVLVLDDVQWLDEASAALWHFLARADFGGRVLIACAARAGELGDNTATLRVVRALERQRALVQHGLAPLGPAETAMLVQAVDPELDAGRIFAGSEGNPLFALELARASALGAQTAHESLDKLLDERLERLSAPARELLPWAAALGRSFDPELLALVRNTSSTELLHALEQLERHGVVRAASALHYDFTHDLLRQAAYRRLSQPRRRLVHLQIARGLQAARGGDDELAFEIAHHASQGGDALLAAQASLTASRRCVRLFAQAEAAELAIRGLQHLPRIERITRIRLELALRAVLVESGRAQRNARVFEAELSRAIVEAQEAGLHAEAAEGFRIRSVLHYHGEDFDGARDSAVRALDAVGTSEPATRGRLLADTARCLLLLEQDVPRAQALLGEARALLGPDADRVANVAWATALFARFSGEPSVALPAFEAAVAGFTREQAHWEHCQAMAQRVMLELENGAAAAARDECAPLAAVAAKMSGGSEPAVAAALAALSGRALDEPDATARFEQAIADLRIIDAKAMLAYMLNTAASQDLDAGDVAAAERRAEAALSAASVVGRRSEIVFARALLGRAAVARGDRSTATNHLEAVRRDREAPLRLSSRAARAVDQLAAALAAPPSALQPKVPRAPRRRSSRPTK